MRFMDIIPLKIEYGGREERRILNALYVTG